MNEVTGYIQSGGNLTGQLEGPAAITGSPSTGITRVYVRDYERLDNLPSIEDVTLIGNRSLTDFGMGFADAYDIHQLFRG